MSALEFLGLQATHNPHRWYLPVERRLCAGGQFLFGGAGLATAVAALEATCERPLIWATAQYLSFARPGSIIDLDVTIPVAGRHTTQARAIGHVGDTEIFTANAALGTRPLEIAAQWAAPPDVPRPDECPPLPPRVGIGESIHSSVQLRVARGRFGEQRDGTLSADGRSALWARVPGVAVCSATLSLIADWIPSGIGQALGVWAHANSLDNTIRIVDAAGGDEWVLCDIRVLGIRGGFGHGMMHLWSEGGRLLATASQSVIVRMPEG